MPDEKDNGGSGYEIGYGKPPKRTQFQKGHSGNRAGRPKGSRSFKSLLMAALNEKVTVKENGESRQVSKREAAAIQIANKAALGDLRSAKFAAELLDPIEARQDEKVNDQNHVRASDRINAKLDDLRARFRAQQGLPPEENGTES